MYTRLYEHLLNLDSVDLVGLIDIFAGKIIHSNFSSDFEGKFLLSLGLIYRTRSCKSYLMFLLRVFLGIRNIARAFKGRDRFLYEDGIILSHKSSHYVIEDQNKHRDVILGRTQGAYTFESKYGSATEAGGCVIVKVDQFVAVVVTVRENFSRNSVLEDVLQMCSKV